jgi:hypothetical protein
MDSMTDNELRYLRDQIDERLKVNRPEPKWQGGETLWHKVWKKRVRCVYEDDDENYRVRCWWEGEPGGWVYQDKYSGDSMAENDLEPFTKEKEDAEKEALKAMKVELRQKGFSV